MEENNLLRTLIDAIPDYIFIKDREGKFVISNIAHAQAAGVSSSDELVGKDAYDTFPKELADQYHRDDVQVIESGEPLLNHERRTVDADGNERWVLTNKIPLRNAEGIVTGLVGISRNITDRKRAETALRESEAKYRTLFEDANAAILIANSTTHHLLDVNQNVMRLTGYTREELLQLNIDDLVPSLLDNKEIINWQSVEMKKNALIETTIHAKDSIAIPVEVSFRIVQYGDEDVIQAFVRDTTEQTLRENLLQESQFHLVNVLETANDGIVQVDDKGNILLWNTATTRMFGYSREEMMGETIFRVFPERFHQMMQDRWQSRALLEEWDSGSEIFELIGARKNGREFPVEVSLSRWDNEDQTFITSIFRDITDRKQVAQLLGEERQQLRTLIDTIPDYIFIKDRQGKFVISNIAHTQAAGVSSSDELVGKDAYDTFPKELADQYHQDDAQVMESGESLLNHERRTVDAHGNERWVLTNKIPLHNAEGIVTGLVGISRNITKRKQAEIQQRESEARLRAIVKAHPDIVFVQNEDGQYVEVLTASQDLLYAGSTQLEGKYVRDVLPHNAASTVLSVIRQALSENRTIRYNYELEMPAGLRYLDAQIAPIDLTSDGKRLVINVIRDITELKRAEESLKNRAMQQAVIVQLGLQALVSDDLSHIMDDVVALVAATLNVEYCKILELLPDGEHLLLQAGVGWKKGYVGLATVESGIDSQAGFTLSTLDPVIVDDLRTETRFSGPAILQEHDVISGISVIIHRANQIYGVLGVHSTQSRSFSREDVSFIQSVANIIGIAIERHHTSKSLRSSEALFRKLMETTPSGIIIIQNDHLHYANTSAEILTGYTVDELVGKPILEIIHSEYHPLMQELLSPDQEEVTQWHFEINIVTKSGNEHAVYLSTAVTEFEQSPAILAAMVDLTERKQTEAALRERDRLQIELDTEREVNELKSQFVSMVSHEFRTPLATIQATTDALHNYRDRMNEEQKEKRFERIHEQIGHLTSLMDDVLVIGKDHESIFHREQLDLDHLFQEVIEDFRQNTANHELQYSSEGRCLAYVDKSLIRQLVTNLLSNAIKYSPEGTRVHLALDCKSTHLVFSVADAGIGIPQEDQEKLFTDFHRASNVGTISGTGLGLAIVKRAVQLHGGTITTESQVNIGTTFTVRIPKVLLGEE